MVTLTAEVRPVSPLAVLQRSLAVVQSLVAVVLIAGIAVMLFGVAPTFFGLESFTVRSGSMEPAIHVGALTVVKPVSAADLQPGDIITYRTPTQPDLIVTHRLIAIEKSEDGRQQYRTKGDANNVEDLVLVDPNAVLGKVLYSVPYAGYTVEFTKQTTGRLLLIGLPALLLAIDYTRQRLRRRGLPATSIGVVDLAGRERVDALLVKGNQALDAGQFQLAERAADGVLAIEPRNENGWLLKAESQSDARNRIVLLQTALSINPGATRIASRLEELTFTVAPESATPTKEALDGAAHGG
ncbi:MAG TPA: signal peptidase I [Chloroflexota bacterium]|nr:signal peptidase I [Chloroflexota bacterium]